MTKRPTIPREATNQPADPPSAKDVIHLFSQGLRYFVFPLTILFFCSAVALLYVVGLIQPKGWVISKDEWAKPIAALDRQ